MEGQYQNLRAAKLDAYKSALEACGQVLERRGIPPAYATVAMSAYSEACIACLVNLGVREMDLALALARLHVASQLFVVAGYATRRWSSWWRFAERERLRFSQDLHDEIGHDLVVLKLYLELMAMDVKNGKTEDIGQKLQEAMTLVSLGIASVRRLILDLGPAMLDELGLGASLKLYARQFSTRTGIQVQIVEGERIDIPKSHETALYRVVQGALSNVAKHAKAKNVKITLGTMKGAVTVMIVEDDGVGFDIAANRSQRFGLTAMRDRIEAIGGRLHVESKSASQGGRSGTRIEVDLPVKGKSDDKETTDIDL
jgi:signal transduction histidine kinase